MIRVSYSPAQGVEVDGVPWSRLQVDQARRDSKACRESRGHWSPKANRIVPAKHCDCVCCRVDQLFRRKK